MDLISKRDALDKVHKTIENLILRLPRVRGADGEDYCAAPASLASYNMAYAEIRREIQGIPSWHTEDPEEGGEYLVTWEGVDHGRRRITGEEEMGKTKYIDAEALIDELDRQMADLEADVKADKDNVFLIGLAHISVVSTINDFPTADVVEVSKVRQVLLDEFGAEETEAIDALMERMK